MAPNYSYQISLERKENVFLSANTKWRARKQKI
jgi:hypothetical protein